MSVVRVVRRAVSTARCIGSRHLVPDLSGARIPMGIARWPMRDGRCDARGRRMRSRGARARARARARCSVLDARCAGAGAGASGARYRCGLGCAVPSPSVWCAVLASGARSRGEGQVDSSLVRMRCPSRMTLRLYRQAPQCARRDHRRWRTRDHHPDCAGSTPFVRRAANPGGPSAERPCRSVSHETSGAGKAGTRTASPHNRPVCPLGLDSGMPPRCARRRLSPRVRDGGPSPTRANGSIGRYVCFT